MKQQREVGEHLLRSGATIGLEPHQRTAALAKMGDRRNAIGEARGGSRRRRGAAEGRFTVTASMAAAAASYGSLPGCKLYGKIHRHASLPPRWGRISIDTPDGLRWLELGPRGASRLSEPGEAFKTRMVVRAINARLEQLGIQGGDR